MANPSNARVLYRFSALALGMATLLAPVRRAQAAPVFGDHGTVVLGAEDITGYYAQSLKFWDRNNRTLELSRSHLSLGLATGGVRLGVHYFLIRGLSVGGTAGFESGPGSNTHQDNPGTWSEDVPTNSRLVIAPRVGYALMFTDVVGLWFRGGLGYERFKLRDPDVSQNYSRESFFMASADILFVWSPFPHFGLLIGPTGDRSLAGRHLEHDPPAGDHSSDSRLWRLGLTSGLAGYF
jgi:hypothetical protein